VYYALERASGRTRWSYDTRQDGGSAQFHGNPLVTEDLLVTGSDGQGAGYVYAFERKTGTPRWKTAVGGLETDLFRFAGMAVGGTTAGELVALDLGSGKIVWRFDTETHPHRRYHRGTPVLLDERVFFGGTDGRVYALRAASGEILWQRDLGCRVSTSLLMADGGLYVGGADGRLYRLDPATGAVTAGLALDGEPHSVLTAAAGSLLVLVGESTLAAIDLDLKQVRWTRVAPEAWSTPRPLIVGKAVLVGNEAGELSAFQTADGKTVWSGKIAGMPRGLSLADAILYVGTLRGTLFAYEMARFMTRFAAPSPRG
jgi:outer membrane protein assembly factor BamB